MGELKVKDKDIVGPGEVLAVGMDYLPAGGAYRDNDSVVASQVGIVSINGRLVKIVALNSKYAPRKGDTVIGKVIDISSSIWVLNINHANDAILPLRDGSNDYIPRGADLRQYYDFDDYVVATVTKVINGGTVEISMKGPGLRKLSEGRILKVNPAKIPRIIGREGSMVSMVKGSTDCRIIAGQNGIVWISGANPEKEIIAVEAIKMIEENAHRQGLTDEVKKFLDNKIGDKNGVQQKE